MGDGVRGAGSGVSTPTLAPVKTAKPADAKPAAPPAPKPSAPGAKDDFQTGAAAAKPLEGMLGPSKGFGHPSAHGAISAAEWADPTKLLAKLTQYPAGRPTAQSKACCGPSNILGAALMSGGPDKASALLKGVATSSSTMLTADEKTQLSDIADKVKSHTATFEDLNKAQELMYRADHINVGMMDAVEEALGKGSKLNEADKRKLQHMPQTPENEAKLKDLLSRAYGVDVDIDNGFVNIPTERHTKENSGMLGDEVWNIAHQGGMNVSDQAIASPDIKKVAESLQPGESVTMRVTGKTDGKAPDHYVTLGRKQDGTYYLYNPDPGKGDATLTVGRKSLTDGDFLKQIDRYNDRMQAERGQIPKGIKIGN